MEPLRFAEISDALGCASVGTSGEVTGVSIDNRKVSKGDLFFCIKGDRFDGHDFASTAVGAGAAAVVASKPLDVSVPVFLVDDTRTALLDLAQYYRSSLPVMVVGVTGSVGKTSTKEMIYTVLSHCEKTLKTEGNLNNEIGLPRTLFRLDASDSAAVIEMGMSHFGEISRLTKTAQPNIGVITNIGVSHMENLGSQQGIRKAKLEILDGMAPDAPLITNGDDPLLRTLKDELDRKVVLYGIENKNADIVANDISCDGISTRFTVNYGGGTETVTIPTVGEHHVLNALAAFAVGLERGHSPAQIAAALPNYRPAGMRQKLTEFRGGVVIEDCYNASPDSMRASLSVLRQLPYTGRRIAVLGDMLELGETSPKLHGDVGKLAAEYADILFCYGEMAKYIAESAKEAGMKEVTTESDPQKLAEMLIDTIRPQDVTLFKASRGMHLEDVMERVYQADTCGEQTRSLG